MRISDWSSDVCSSDLRLQIGFELFAGLTDRGDDLGEACDLGELFVQLFAVLGDTLRLIAHRRLRRVQFGAQPLEFGLGLGQGPAQGFLLRLRGAAILGERPGGSEEHTSELQSLMRISYAVFCLKKKR